MLHTWNILWETTVYSKAGSKKPPTQSSTYFLFSFFPADADDSKTDCDALDQGWQTMVHWPNPATYFFVNIFFFWNTAVVVHFSIILRCSCATIFVVAVTETIWTTSLKYLLLGYLQKFLLTSALGYLWKEPGSLIMLSP